MTEQKIKLKMIRMSEVQSQEIEWLWYPFIPYGKLTIIQGDPGDGKTTMVLNLAAKLSKGEALDQKICCLCHDRHVRIASHYNSYFCHRSFSFSLHCIY